MASRMQGPLKGRSRRWVPQLVQSERGGSSKSLLLSLYKPPALCKNETNKSKAVKPCTHSRNILARLCAGTAMKT